jgi:hypothetical protein
MAKGAATEQELGDLHSKLTSILSKVLAGYEKKIDLVHRVLDAADPEDEMLSVLIEQNIEPSPAMLSAVAKFLKDNEISVDSKELNQLSAQEERLANRKRNRPNLASITDLQVIKNG